MAESAAEALAARVDDRYDFTRGPLSVVVLGRPVLIPSRIHFVGLKRAWPQLQGKLSPATRCLCTRSTDGYVRQAALRSILGINEPWAVPFVVLLAGEYVVEIVVDMVAYLPSLERRIYAEFALENRHLMGLLQARAVGYWDCYYCHSYPDRKVFPGLVFLHQLETWANDIDSRCCGG